MTLREGHKKKYHSRHEEKHNIKEFKKKNLKSHFTKIMHKEM